VADNVFDAFADLCVRLVQTSRSKRMQVFTVIDSNLALVRYPKGVFRQVQMYRRGDRVYLPHSGGYIEVRGLQPHDGSFATSHPDIKLLEFDNVDDRIHTVRHLGLEDMRWKQ
jgi:hypothetical protein